MNYPVIDIKYWHRLPPNDSPRDYWGNGSFFGMFCIGIISYCDRQLIGTGALFKNKLGDYFIGNNGVLRPLPCEDIKKARAKLGI